MKKNMGLTDRLIRTLLAVVVIILYLVNQITGTAAVILGIIAIIFLLTSAIGLCPLYLPLKISTAAKVAAPAPEAAPPPPPPEPAAAPPAPEAFAPEPAAAPPTPEGQAPGGIGEEEPGMPEAQPGEEELKEGE